jgi:hypothetical protein
MNSYPFPICIGYDLIHVFKRFNTLEHIIILIPYYYKKCKLYNNLDIHISVSI